MHFGSKLIHQRTFLRDERRRLRIASEQIEERQRALKMMSRGDWIPEPLKQPAESHKLLNISGLMFEAPVSILMRDKGSLLAQLCSSQPPILPDPDGGFFYFDRDWYVPLLSRKCIKENITIIYLIRDIFVDILRWLFRYILNFLRDGALPDDRSLLAEVCALYFVAFSHILFSPFIHALFLY